MTISARVRRIGTLSFLFVGLLFAAMLLRGQWSSLSRVMTETRSFEWVVHPAWLAGAVGLGIGNLFLMAVVWARLFHRMGGVAGRDETVRVWVVTNFGRYIPGKVWQLGGLAVYMRGRGDSGAVALVSATVFQIVALVTGAAVAVATMGVRWAGSTDGWWLGMLALGVALLGGLHPGVIRWMARLLGSWMGEAEVTVRLGGTDVARAGMGMLLAWFLYGTGLLMLFRGVGVPWEVTQLPLLTGIFAASYVLGYLVLVAPGGLVVREGAMTALLVEAGGLTLGVAAALAVMARLWMVATELGALGLVLARPGTDRTREKIS